MPISIRITGPGKTPSEYTLSVRRDALIVDYIQETAAFDETRFAVTDMAGQPLHSGDSITHLVTSQFEEPGCVMITDTLLHTQAVEYIPQRKTMVDVPIDFEAEQTATIFSDRAYYSCQEDLSEAVQGCYKPLPLTPGQDLYIWAVATETQFKTPVFHLEVPARPAAPELTVTSITENSLQMQPVPDAIYSLGETAVTDPVFMDLTPGETYTVEAAFLATYDRFMSEIASLTVTLPVPSAYGFTVQYIRPDGTPCPSVPAASVAFTATGAFDRKAMPLPAGYQEVQPEVPSEEWLHPTALVWDGSQWTVTAPVVTVVLEHTAHEFGDTWHHDDSRHWKECACGDRTDEADHTLEWVVDRPATLTEAGQKHLECPVCGYKEAAVEIPMLTEEPEEDGNLPDTGVMASLLVIPVTSLLAVLCTGHRRKHR